MSSKVLSNRLLSLWRNRKPAVVGWLGIGNPVTAEYMGRAGFDACLVDMQHGMIDEGTAISMFAGLLAAGCTPIARVRNNDSDKIHFMLDSGALGIVSPLINTAKQVEELVANCKYPPQGTRSFGPGRGYYITNDYFQEANDNIATIAMIETKEAMDNLDKILEVPGLDGVFIGPNDLALALGMEPSSTPSSPAILNVIQQIRKEAHAKGKKAGIFTGNGYAARNFLDQGFDMVNPGWDVGYLQEGARREIGEAKSGHSTVHIDDKKI